MNDTRADDGSRRSTPLSYDQAGVDYDLIDPLKVAAQRAAAATGAHLARHGFGEVAASRGESAYVVDVGPVLPGQHRRMPGHARRWSPTRWPR